MEVYVCQDVRLDSYNPKRKGPRTKWVRVHISNKLLNQPVHLAALEIIDYFLKRGSEIFTIPTDMSKAFDLALHSKMFMKMFEAKRAPIYIRLIIYIYWKQEANVLWNSTEK